MMMIILEDGVWSYLSAIIALCGPEFCTFVSDTRMVVNSSRGYVPVSEETQKIFNLNERVLFGVTGLFEHEQGMLDPFLSQKDRAARADLEDIKSMVVEYLEAHKFDVPPARTYLVGGKRNDGTFGMYEIVLRVDGPRRVEVTPRHPDGGIALSMALPPRALKYQNALIEIAQNAVSSSRTLDEVQKKFETIIWLIADMDNTVGKKTQTITLT